MSPLTPSSDRHADHAAWTQGFQRFGWWMPLRFVLMTPLIPVAALGVAAQVLFDWLDARLR